MAMPNARLQYLKTQVETASKEQLVVMLFDGIIRFSEVARKAIESKQIEESHHALMRAQAIVMELICTVDKDKGGEIASNLLGLHAYSFNCLVSANMHKDTTKIDEVQKIYRELREGWVGAMESLGILSTGAKTAAPATAAPTAGKAAAPAPRVLGAPQKAPAAPAAAAPRTVPAPAPTKPTVGPGGIMAKTTAVPTPVPAAVPRPAAPAGNGYGMGRTALMGGAYGNAAGSKLAGMPSIPRPAAVPTPAPAAAAPAPAPVPATGKPAVVPTPAKPAVPMNAKQAAMLNAYQAGSRSIA